MLAGDARRCTASSTTGVTLGFIKPVNAKSTKAAPIYVEYWVSKESKDHKVASKTQVCGESL